MMFPAEKRNANQEGLPTNIPPKAPRAMKKRQMPSKKVIENPINLVLMSHSGQQLLFFTAEKKSFIFFKFIIKYVYSFNYY